MSEIIIISAAKRALSAAAIEAAKTAKRPVSNFFYQVVFAKYEPGASRFKLDAKMVTQTLFPSNNRDKAWINIIEGAIKELPAEKFDPAVGIVENAAALPYTECTIYNVKELGIVLDGVIASVNIEDHYPGMIGVRRFNGKVSYTRDLLGVLMGETAVRCNITGKIIKPSSLDNPRSIIDRMIDAPGTPAEKSFMTLEPMSKHFATVTVGAKHANQGEETAEETPEA